MAKNKSTVKQRSIETYEHRNKDRKNNPLVGLVTPDTDPDLGNQRRYSFDPHLDPQLQWASKSEHTSFDVPTVSLHVHERIDPQTIIKAVRTKEEPAQPSLFDTERDLPWRHVVEFYRHAQNWSNRLIAGDSLLVMNSLIEKEGMADKIQMIYIDPPYGIKYSSNFQPFVGKRDVKDGKDSDLTAEPEQIRAFRDTWELGIHSYLNYLRDRLLLTRELLAKSGSVFVQINEENVHRVRLIMDEIFGVNNFVRSIAFAKTGSMVSSVLGRTCDYLLWYSKNKTEIKYRRLFIEKRPDNYWSNYELPDGTRHTLSKAQQLDLSQIPEGAKIFGLASLESAGSAKQDTPFEFEGEIFRPDRNSHWKLSWPDGMNALRNSGRIVKVGNKLRYKDYILDNPVKVMAEIWLDTMGFGFDKRYVVETRPKVIERCMLMCTDPSDIVFDPTCGSGTTAYVSEKWGRRWITCDTSRVALALARQRLMTSVYDYYSLAHPAEGISSGFKYKTVPYITRKSIADNPDIKEGMTKEKIEEAIIRHANSRTLYDQPLIESNKKRVCGPFTVEAVPAPAVKDLDDPADYQAQNVDATVARSGETQRQADWRIELLKSGVRSRDGKLIHFSRLEALPACRYLHADGELKNIPDSSSYPRIVVSFGSEFAPLEQRQVELALQDAGMLKPKPEFILFAAFQFDPEAAKDIEEAIWPGVTLLKAQMNNDLLTEDLKKKRSSNESFWLVGQPDVFVEQIRKGPTTGQWQVTVRGFDYFNTVTGKLESGNKDKISLWMLDTDYDGRCLFPRQVFFPMENSQGGWTKLAKNLKAEIDLDTIEVYKGIVSLPFELGENRRIAIKIVDNRGIESLKIITLQNA